MSNSYEFDQIINSKYEYHQNLYDQGANTYNSLVPSSFSADDNRELFKQPSKPVFASNSDLRKGQEKSIDRCQANNEQVPGPLTHSDTTVSGISGETDNLLEITATYQIEGIGNQKARLKIVNRKYLSRRRPELKQNFMSEYVILKEHIIQCCPFENSQNMHFQIFDTQLNLYNNVNDYNEVSKDEEILIKVQPHINRIPNSLMGYGISNGMSMHSQDTYQAINNLASLNLQSFNQMYAQPPSVYHSNGHINRSYNHPYQPQMPMLMNAQQIMMAQQVPAQKRSVEALSSSTEVSRGTQWFNRETSSNCSKPADSAFSFGKNMYDDVSMVSNSTESMIKMTSKQAEVIEIDYMIDFTKMANPKIDIVFAEGQFIITDLSREVAKAGPKNIDIILKIGNTNLKDLNKESAMKMIENLTKQKRCINVTIGRLKHKNELSYLQRQVNVPNLDSISTAPISSDAFSNKENLSPTTESSMQEINEMTFDDLRHNLTFDSSLENIVQAMKHPDSKLNREMKIYCSFKIHDSFTGIDIIKWIKAYVKGVHTDGEGKKFAQRLLNANHIINPPRVPHTEKFSSKTLYVFVNNETKINYSLDIIQEENEESAQGNKLKTDSSFASTNGILRRNNSPEEPSLEKNGSIRRSGRYAYLV